MLYVMPIFLPNNADDDIYYFLYEKNFSIGAEQLLMQPSIAIEICEKYRIKIILSEFNFDSSTYNKLSVVPFIVFPDDDSADYDNIVVEEDFVNMQKLPLVMQQQAIEAKTEKDRFLFTKLKESMDYIKDLSSDTKILLTREFFNSDALYKKMKFQKTSFNLPDSNNISIFQKDSTSPICLALPSIENIMFGKTSIADTDILKLIAPYRKVDLQRKISTYLSQFHTPFFRLGIFNSNKIGTPEDKRRLPSSFSWLYGVPKNNLLNIQDNEKQMFNNMYLLYCQDISLNFHIILTGLLLHHTLFGKRLQKLIGMNKEYLLNEIHSILNDAPSYINCRFNENKINSLPDDCILNIQSLTNLFDNSFYITTDGVINLVNSIKDCSRIVPIKNAGISLNILNSTETEIIDILIKEGFITNHLFEFYLTLCQYAYRINWGHNGMTDAISELTSEKKREEFDKTMSKYLASIIFSRESKSLFDSTSYNDTEDLEEDISDSFDEDEISVPIYGYISQATFSKLLQSGVATQLETGKNALDNATTDQKIIERWRINRGEDQLASFIKKSFNIVKDAKFIISTFIRLLRWGEERKPTTLVYSEYPSLTTMFDLNEAIIDFNTFVVNEDSLIKNDDCTYSLEAILVSKSKLLNMHTSIIVGFLLYKDYGVTKKYFIASWDDLYELSYSNEPDIAQLKTLTNNLSSFKESPIYIEDLEKSDYNYNFYTSQFNIEVSKKYNCKANDLSECFLLLKENIISTIEYRKALQSSEIATIADRQYKILHNYLEKLGKFYQLYQNNINSFSTSKELLDVVNLWHQISNASNSSAISADSIGSIKKMSFKTSTISKYTDITLNDAKYILISDPQMKSNLPNISFKDTTMQIIANRTKNRVVLLLVETTYKGEQIFVFARNDEITPDNIKTIERDDKKSIAHLFYYTIDRIFKSTLETGKIVADNKTYMLHSSLKGCV